MKISISCDGNKVAEHFGRCEKYILFEEENGELKNKTVLPHPGHEPFMIPRMLNEKGAKKIICKDIGPRAINLFAELGIEVLSGVQGEIDEVIESYLKERLKTAGSECNQLE